MSEHIYQKVVYYHDTDCAGVVYYANYLKYLEEARTEILVCKGINPKRLAEDGVGFAVAKVEIQYKSPARYQDRITVKTSILKTKLSTIQFKQDVYREDDLLASAIVTVVLVGKDFRPIPIPKEIKQAIEDVNDISRR
ncbi:MAG: YbgC/FadM family acyl-CoA thioesterase [Thermodesulfovibrionales bacterium]|nr:YbgC/FadM family acyl-CoA thioesterase [Thermodesulfovibrionales bacterium]